LLTHEAVHGHRSPAGDEPENGVTRHRRAEPAEPNPDVAEALDRDALRDVGLGDADGARERDVRDIFLCAAAQLSRQSSDDRLRGHVPLADRDVQGIEVGVFQIRGDLLERDGLVQRIGHRRGTGKPSNLYQLTPAAELLFSQAYAHVLRQLLDVLREQLPPGGLDDVLREVGRRMANEQGLTEANLAERLARALAMLDQLGGVATADMRDNTVLIHSYSCPLVASVPAHPELCRMTETLLGQVLGAPVRERCDRSDPPRCCFEVALTPAPTLPRAA